MLGFHKQSDLVYFIETEKSLPGCHRNASQTLLSHTEKKLSVAGFENALADKVVGANHYLEKTYS